MNTPQPIDQFARFMAGIYDERKIIAVSTGFQAFFGNPAGGGRTHYTPDALSVDIEIVRGNKKIAALIPRGTVSRPLGPDQKDMLTGKVSSFNRKYPLSEESGSIGANEILFRQAGEGSYSERTRLDRMREKARDLHFESIRRHVRLFEILAMTSIMTGKMPAILGTTNVELMFDFMRQESHSITVTHPWTDNDNADIMGNLDTSCDLVESEGSENPDMLCIGGSALSAMVNNTTFQNLADNRRIEFIQVSRDLPVPAEFDRFVKAGWIPQGRIRTPKGYSLWLFTYPKTYQNSAGEAVKLMHETQAFITSSKARFDRYFGPPEILPVTTQRAEFYREMFGFDPTLPPMPANILGNGSIIEPAAFYCDAYPSEDWKTVTIRTQSAPIFATTQTDAIVVLSGLVG